jgi:chromosome segregation ATPase
MPVSRWVIAVCGLALAADPALAQQDPNPQALARAQSLLRQVSAQKQELEVANARLTAEVNDLRRKLQGAETSLKQTSLDLDSEQRKAARAAGTLDSTRERLERTEQTLREAIERLRNSNGELQNLQRESAALGAQVAGLEAELADSERKNLQLYEANLELLDLYRRKGPVDALLQREPVTGIGRVGIENVLLEYQAKLEDSLRSTHRQGPQGPGSDAPATDGAIKP